MYTYSSRNLMSTNKLTKLIVILLKPFLYTHPKIQFTIEDNFKELSFLDILMINQIAHIITDIYLKLTDTEQ